MVIPFAPSLQYYMSGRENPGDTLGKLNRTLIQGRDKPVLLTVPLQKGSTLISGHGNWMHTHLGTLNAIYGHSPYFPFLFDQIRGIYARIEPRIADSEGVSILELNKLIHEAILSWIDFDALESVRRECDEAIRNGRFHSNEIRRWETILEVNKELSTNVNTEISILDAIFRLGKKATFLLLRSLDFK